ncbi:hypothetical protein CR513_50625, partial [Mucuna pruriens]
MPCAAHCLDLMLEDIRKITKVKKVIRRGIKLVGYIYNHSLSLNIMRKFTNKSELVRQGVTRFATTFFTLQRLHKQKTNLRRMFTSDEWEESRAAKDSKGPAMGYIYETMSGGKEAIQKAFNGNEDNNPNIEMDYEVLEGLYKCIDRLSENDEFVNDIHNDEFIRDLVIHSKKRGKFEYQKLQELVYVK